MIGGGVADKISQCEPSLQGKLFFLFFFFKNNSLYNKMYTQGTVYYVIDQLGSPDRRELANRSSMSNQEPKKKHVSPYL